MPKMPKNPHAPIFNKDSVKRILQQEMQRRNVDRQIYNWDIQARKNQTPPDGNWTTWMILAGRGFGKTRTGSETIRRWVRNNQSRRIALIGQTIQETINVMLHGESGLLNISPKNEQPHFHKQHLTLTWPNGAIAQILSAQNYEKLRGPQFDTAWVDEFAKFKKPQELWQQLMLCLRLGKQPRCIVTTTPRPLPFLQKLIQNPLTHVTKGSTFDNQNNLSPHYINHILKEFEHSPLGLQEIYGHLLEDHQGALWKRNLIAYKEPPQQFKRMVIAIDPATTHHEQSDETGIITAGLCDQGNFYVIRDDSGKYSPLAWAQKIHDLYTQYPIDRIVAETNKGGAMVEGILRNLNSSISYKGVYAKYGKQVRAEPIVALYEQKKVFHTKLFLELEEQLCSYIPGESSKSPDRLDALVWAIHELSQTMQTSNRLRVWT